MVNTAKPARRISLLSPTALAAVVTALGAAALHLAFPRTGAWWIIPFALAVLFRTWAALPPKAAALNGYISGLVFFTLSFTWFGETAAALVGGLGFIIDLGPAIAEAFAFAFAAFITSLAAQRCNALLAPAVAACAFVAAEWMRSSGLLGVPVGQLGLPLIDSPLRPGAAFIGGYGLTLLIALIGAYAAAAWTDRRLLRPAIGVIAGICAITAVAWTAWPARTLAPPAIRVAAVQGNIMQSVKATYAARTLAVQRYTAMTDAIVAQHPTLIVWPETVILTDMTHDDALRAQFGALAKRAGSTIAVGTITTGTNGELYNTLVYFNKYGGVSSSVSKRQLVPFAEFLPLPKSLRTIPAVNEIGNFSPGQGPQIDPVTKAGTLICWESMFGDVALDQVHAGAQFFAVATDDAWFGTSDGPYQHAQATTLRAVETGRWIVRAAATGISGIVGPDGVWRNRTALETQETIVGNIGAPVAAPYTVIGPYPIGIACLIVALAGLIPWRRAS